MIPPSHTYWSILPACLAAVAFCATYSVGAAPAEKVSFNREIRPIFSDTCFQCHGPDEAKRKAGLRLDERASAVKPSESGEIAIVPGKPEESELVKRLRASDPEDVMPPPKLHKTITPAQIATIERWIAEGAEYQGHWAFIAPKRTEPPHVNPHTGQARNAIDQFLMARLEREGLKLSPEAEKATLIRRVALDLTGIPPTPQEVDAFVADTAPNAYEKVVDRLLASPRYGERMAVQWLDFARYADSNGFQTDTSRQMWPWREWVINAFNRNLPFDRFTIEQLAGDLLPKPTRDQIVATGFHRNAPAQRRRRAHRGGVVCGDGDRSRGDHRPHLARPHFQLLPLPRSQVRSDHAEGVLPVLRASSIRWMRPACSTTSAASGAKRTGGNSRPVLALPTPEEDAKIAKLEAAVNAAQEKRKAAQQRACRRLQQAWEPKFLRRRCGASARPGIRSRRAK